jgi:hypothetical protein
MAKANACNSTPRAGSPASPPSLEHQLLQGIADLRRRIQEMGVKLDALDATFATARGSAQ